MLSWKLSNWIGETRWKKIAAEEHSITEKQWVRVEILRELDDKKRDKT